MDSLKVPELFLFVTCVYLEVGFVHGTARRTLGRIRMKRFRGVRSHARMEVRRLLPGLRLPQ